MEQERFSNRRVGQIKTDMRPPQEAYLIAPGEHE